MESKTEAKFTEAQSKLFIIAVEEMTSSLQALVQLNISGFTDEELLLQFPESMRDQIDDVMSTLEEVMKKIALLDAE